MNKKINLSDVSLSTWIRTALMILSFVNLGLQLMGKNILPISDAQVSEIISFVFAAVTSFVAWWKNNSFTDSAQRADKVLKENIK